MSTENIKILFIIFCISLTCKVTPSTIEQTGAADITVDCNFDTVYHTISKNLIGFNMTYSFCTDKFWKNTDIKPALKKMKTGFIRYPDGEPTSYYHWNNLNGEGYMDNWDPAYNHTNDQNPKNYTDLDEYISICRETGAKPLVGINMESGIIYNRVKDGIEEAKALVKYCLENNYGVKYFFLDNEPYHSNSHYKMTVDEYIEQIKLYAPELKKINPEIKLIVNWDANLNDNRFWKLLIQTHNLIDYMDVHWYWSWGKVTFSKWYNTLPMTVDNDWYKPGRTYKEEIEYFNQQAKIKGVGNVKLISLEWNVGPSENIYVTPNEYQSAMIQSEMLMQFMDGDMEMATLWAFFWITKNGTSKFANRFLMNYNDNYKLAPCYDMFTLLSEALDKQKCGVSSSTKTVYPLAVKSKDNKEKIVFLMHKGVFETYTEVKAPKGKDYKLDVFSMEKGDNSIGRVNTASCVYDEESSSYRFKLPGFALARLTIRN